MSSLHDIKKLRKKFHLNQKELAEQAGVSQSLIAKIEAGKVEPTYTKAQQIFETLENLQEVHEVKAKEVMNKKVIFAGSTELLRNTIKTMKNKSISQMPVINKEKIVGFISEGTILRRISDHPEKISSLKVEDVMEDAPPIISPKTGLKTLLHLLQNNPIVLVADKGDIKGIISKADLLGKME